LLTNQTALCDYEKAMGPQTALLKVHRSNFFMDGFVDSPKTGNRGRARAQNLPSWKIWKRSGHRNRSSRA
jgi:hypothetical protein